MLRHVIFGLVVLLEPHGVVCPPPAGTRPARLEDLDDFLLDLICELSVRKVSHLCKALLRRPPSEFDLVHELASLGGSHESNAERDLHSLLRRKPWRKLMPDLYPFPNYVCRAKESAGAKRCTSYALLPHEVFHSVYTTAPDLFDFLFRGNDANLIDFWRETQQRSTSWYDSHPAVARQPDARKRVPIGTHGDDTGIWQHEKVLIISWNSVAVNTDTFNNKILFCAVQLLSALPGITLNEYYDVLRWSLNCLSSGFFPDKDWLHSSFASR